MKKTKNQDTQKKNGPVIRRIFYLVIKSVESALKPKESVWWERFVEEVGFDRE